MPWLILAFSILTAEEMGLILAETEECQALQDETDRDQCLADMRERWGLEDPAEDDD